MIKVINCYKIGDENYSNRKLLDDMEIVKSKSELSKLNLIKIPVKSLLPKSKSLRTKKNNISSTIKLEILNFVKICQINPDLSICLTGKAFEYFLKFYRNENNYKKSTISEKNEIISNYEDNKIFHMLGEILINKCKVFARMQPSNKVELIKFLKENKDNIVGMCGDGANDCGALLNSDVGISICNKKSKNNNITSHFYSHDDSIKCIEISIKNGRACYENSIITLKFMIMYGIIQICSCLISFISGFSDIGSIQYLYIDCFTVLITSLLASK